MANIDTNNPHKIMTKEELIKINPQGKFMVMFGYDNIGNVAIWWLDNQIDAVKNNNNSYEKRNHVPKRFIESA